MMVILELWIFWKLPLNKEDEDYKTNGKAIVKVTNLMPEFHLRQMYRDSVEKYKNAVKSTNKSLMNFIYQDLTGHRSSSVSLEMAKNQAQVVKFISNWKTSGITRFKKAKWKSKINKIWWILRRNKHLIQWVSDCGAREKAMWYSISSICDKY